MIGSRPDGASRVRAPLLLEADTPDTDPRGTREDEGVQTCEFSTSTNGKAPLRGQPVEYGDSASSPSGSADLAGESESGATGSVSGDAGSGYDGSDSDIPCAGADPSSWGWAARHRARGAERSKGGSTLLISNVPAYFTQRSLLATFEDLTPAMRGNFDFFYCPWEQEATRNFGRATINFTSDRGALAFQREWSSRGLCPTGDDLEIAKASLQGLEANVKYFSRHVASCTDPRHRPMLRGENGLFNTLSLAGDQRWIPPRPRRSRRAGGAARPRHAGVSAAGGHA